MADLSGRWIAKGGDGATISWESVPSVSHYHIIMITIRNRVSSDATSWKCWTGVWRVDSSRRKKKSTSLSIAERAERPGDEQPFNPTTGDQHERAKAP
ncbi:MAG: hypothetical protein KUL87_07850 [Pseudomonas sp.]|nr:hypothetical protein [Pseudomonas sp.]